MRGAPLHRLALLLAIAGTVPPVWGTSARARNVIIMVADGVGPALVTAARLARGGANGPQLALESLAHFGYQRTHASDDLITDSAAAASGWACGVRIANHRICDLGDGRPAPDSLLDLARASGRSTGLVATSTITHATPAAFAASVPDRDCQSEIARQYLEEARVDVILGGGRGRFASNMRDPCGGGGMDYLPRARDLGYQVVDTAADLSRAPADGKILGLFAEEALRPVRRRGADTSEPTLTEMTRAALSRLERDRDGFFLVVEGSQPDWGAHENDLDYAVAELLAFDDAVNEVLAWLAARPKRAKETLLIVLSDHETGGLALIGPKDRPLPAGPVRAIPHWATTEHTAVDAPIWSAGPGSAALAGLIDSTKVFSVVRGAMSK